ncbi:MAG: pyridoxal phosphate-dependent aminotransferase [Rhizobiales bacterium]|nr:pyridoxal phosphate-dependent aminotransferase [Hyphomicrobiales bacterium]
MKVPFVDLKRFEDGFIDRWESKVKELSLSTSFIGGKEVAVLEEKLSEYLDVSHVVTCSNGTDAIQIALRAVGVENDDLVLIPDVTFWATFEAVINVGAKPITIDVDKSSGGVDKTTFFKAAKKFKPKAAILAHLYGWGTPYLNDIRKFCIENNIFLIEDGAQCFGTNYFGESIYKNAQIATTSFYPAKVLGAAGDGGAIFTNNHELSEIARKLTNHGRDEHYGHGYVGWNSRLDALQAAYLNISLDYIDSRIESRRSTCRIYENYLKDTYIQHIKSSEDFQENGYTNLCIIEDHKLKTKIEQGFNKLGIGYGNIYPGAMSDQNGASNKIHTFCGIGNSKVFCKSVFNLPVFPYMKNEEIEFTIDSLDKLVS